jgi:hypothetical protein
MTRKWTVGTRVALGGLTAAAALIAATPAARADEAVDLRTNQEVLQRRVDQLAQSGNAGLGPVLEETKGGPVGVQMLGGSFPRSFLIPGTDTSIRVGGEIKLNSTYWITGGNPNGNSASTNAGTTGQLNTIPLKGMPVGSTNWIARQRDSTLNMSPQQSKMSIETRTPTALGEARSFFEFDWAGDTVASTRPLSGSNNLQPRLRYGYGTLGPLLFGQANSNFNDSDSAMESLDFGGLIGNPGPARIPQIRWTEPLERWGLLGALSVAAEAPETDLFAPNASTPNSFGDDPTAAVTLQPATVPAGVTVPTGFSATPGNPLQSRAPAIVTAWYIPQPWGHVDFATVVRPMLEVNSVFLNRKFDRTFTGFGGAFSGDVKPGWFGWTGDFFTWAVAGGQAMGGYLYAGSTSVNSLVTNMTGNTLLAGTTVVKPTNGYEGDISYRHVWTPEWRSNIGAGMWHLDSPNVSGAVCPAASRATASNGCNLNRDLYMGKVNLIWAPVAFVDIGIEYNYGRRKVLSGQTGDEHVISQRFRLRF